MENKLEKQENREENLFQERKKPSKEAVITTILFLGLIFGLTIGSMINPVRSFSENENRTLQQKPDFSMERLYNGKFTSEYEAFITDQFVLRDSWISLKTYAELAMQKKDISGVFFGKDGYLIETQEKDSINQEQLAKNEDRLKEFIEKYSKKLGADRVHAMIVPTASEVLSDKLPAFAEVFDQKVLLDRISGQLPAGSFVDVTDTLRKNVDNYIFYRTDHHWTAKGAFLAYHNWARASGLQPLEETDFTIKKVNDDFYGTVYSKVNVKVTEPDDIYIYESGKEYTVEYDMDKKKKDTLFELKHLDTKDKYAVYLDGNHALVQIDTKSQEGNGRKLLVIKDSYAHAFTPFAANHYETTYMVDFRYFNMPISQFIESYAITDILVLYNARSFVDDKNFYQITR